MARRILAVDDDRRILEIVRYFLQEKGFEVHIFSNPDEAVEIARTVPFDAIILDIVLQGTDGYRVCSNFKRQPETADVPVLFVSAKVEIAELFLKQFSGTADFLAKPFRRDDLLAKIEGLLARHAEARKAGGASAPKE
jgi:DNA-binding response OmpR family regulator